MEVPKIRKTSLRHFKGEVIEVAELTDEMLAVIVSRMRSPKTIHEFSQFAKGKTACLPFIPNIMNRILREPVLGEHYYVFSHEDSKDRIWRVVPEEKPRA